MLSMGDGLIKYHPFNLREHCRLIVFLPLLSMASISTQKANFFMGAYNHTFSTGLGLFLAAAVIDKTPHLTRE